MGMQKLFSVTAKNQLQIVTLLMKKKPATGFAVLHSLNLQTRVASNYVWLSTRLLCEL